ncbi:MAG TPA: VIT and VWA domain-containing protein, partial [Gemmatimonadaceae bacterium]|nr:VIT and VWA domain-containing protein [Gemmatimonadaceae bacterium]
MTSMGGAGLALGALAERVRPGSCEGTKGERVALQDVEVRATLRDLLCEVRATQAYRNVEARPIEAVYTFPLPLDAVLLDVHVTLGRRELAGVVVEKREAERRYEEAVAEGDGAVMLEQAEPGLYTMNVGNLLPGEVARIAVTYAVLHRWSGDRLRLHFPTTIAPRYGAMPLEPHQVPEHSVTVENRFAFSLTITGALRDAQFGCPTHLLAESRSADALVLSLAQERSVMDRDLVVEVRAAHAPKSVLLTGDDGEGTAAVASFQPRFGGLRQEAPLSLVIVVDCSGSMQGDSIDQASRALREAASQLQSGDRLGIVAFGSHVKRMRDRLAPCTPAMLEQAGAFCRALQADMGGTEIALALHEAYRMLRGVSRGEIFLITDGEVGDWQAVVREARATGHRHFTVGVGSAVSEAFVRELAEATGGACELVSPNEGMTPRIVRHFERMRAPRAKSVRVTWPAGAVDVTPASFGTVFEGDTVVASARFPSRTGAGEVVLEVETAAGSRSRHVLLLADAEVGAVAPAQEAGSAPSTVARLAAARRLATQGEAAARETAVRYRLASPYTNWLVIAERAAEEKATEMPALRKVPQTLAAGWGGIGSVRSAQFSVMADLSMPVGGAPPSMMRSMMRAFTGEMRAFSPPPGSPRGRRHGDDSVEERLVALVNAHPARVSEAHVLHLLDELGMGDVLDRLLQLADAH